MHFYLPVFALALVSAAAPLSTDQLSNIELQFDDAIVVLSDGETHVMKQNEVEASTAEFNNLAAEDWISAPKDGPTLVGLNTTVEDPNATKSTELSRRAGAGNAQLVVPLPNLDFINWDVAMSPIIQAKDNPASLALSAGQYVANGFTAGGSASLKLVPDFLDMEGHYDRTKTTTATLTGTITFVIPKGKYGIIVSQPRTLRVRGYTWSGRPGGSSADYWQFDFYNDKSYSLNGGTLKWVEGIITTCTSTTYPIKFCKGNGSHR